MCDNENDIDDLIQISNPNNEITLYANESEQLDKIEELREIKNKSETKVLKIIHSSLSNLKGLGEFKSLTNVELSSNKIISMNNNFKGLSKIKYLNLSCNMLNNVNGVEFLSGLEEIVLAHNKISNLEGFGLLAENCRVRKCALSMIDMRDNLISSLNQLVYLEALENLNSLVFREKDGTNPICEYENYVDYIKENMRQVRILDNKDIQSIQQYDQEEELFSNYNNQNNFGYQNQGRNTTANIKSQAPFMYDIKYRNFHTNYNNYATTNTTGFNSPQNQHRSLSYRNNNHPSNLLSVYKEEIKNLQSNIEELFRDQKDLVFKYEKNESYWKTKVEDLTNSLKNLKEQNSSLGSIIDDKDFTLREYNNKLSLKENEILNYRRILEDKDNLLTDLNSKFSLLKKDYEFSLIDNEKLLKKYSDLCRELNENKEENRKLKEDLTKEENFYKDLSNKKTEELNQKVRHINTLENKIFDFSKIVSEKQKEIETLVESNNYLQTNVVKYNKIKNETEFELHMKFEKEKEEIVKKYKSQVEEMENNFKKILNNKDEEFIKDIKIIEKSYEDMLSDKENRIVGFKKENEKLNFTLNDCKELLKMSLHNEEKHEKIIKDLEKLNNDLLVEKENLRNKTKIMETEIKEQNEKILSLDSNIKNYKNVVIEKDKEIQSLYEENQKMKKEFSLYNNTIAKLEREINNKNEDIQKLYLKVSSDLNLIKIEELNDIIKTKNLMIDDQTNQIIELKHLINSNENELEKTQSKIDKVRQKYEKKITQIKSDYEELNQHLENQNKVISDYEDAVNNLRGDIEKLIQENDTLNGKIRERDEITKIIQNEINDIREFNESSQKLVLDKNNEVKNLKEIIEELNKNLVNKNRENKEILTHFENYRQEKTDEIEKLNKAISEVQNDMILVLNEYEKQKNVIKMNIQNLNNMFSN